MNELLLSNDIGQIEFEIQHYQRTAGESIFEIGRRLKHVKENDLVHGEWSEWLSKMNMDRTQAHKFIRVSSEFSNVAMSQQIGMNVLYEIATLPESERTKEHVTSKGETKTPDEMTVRELRELKKQLKQREQENDILQKQLEEAENREPEVIEKYSEPEDYQLIKDKLSESEKEREKLRSQLQNWHLTDKERQEKSRKYDELNEAINAMDMKLSKDQLRMKNRKFVTDLVTQSRILMRDVAPLAYAIESLHQDDLEQMNKSLNDVATELYKISRDIKNKLGKGVVINE